MNAKIVDNNLVITYSDKPMAAVGCNEECEKNIILPFQIDTATQMAKFELTEICLTDLVEIMNTIGKNNG